MKYNEINKPLVNLGGLDHFLMFRSFLLGKEQQAKRSAPSRLTSPKVGQEKLTSSNLGPSGR
jgi:hypothetical protein